MNVQQQDIPNINHSNFSSNYQPQVVYQDYQSSQQYSPNFNSNEFINAEEIFQLDQPIKQFNNSMEQMYSKSPSTVLDLDRNYVVKNELNPVNLMDRFERDETMSLTSGSSVSLFDDAYQYMDNGYNFQTQEFNNNQCYAGKQFYTDDATIYEISSVPDPSMTQMNYTKMDFMSPVESQNFQCDYKTNNTINYGLYVEDNNLPFVPQYEQCAF